MRNQQPLNQILNGNREHWDRVEVRAAVRQNFQRVTACRTMALGAEVYASDTEEKIVPHTCKSRACPAAAIEPRCYGSANNGLRCPTFITLGSTSQCRTFFGQYSAATAICCTTCRHSPPPLSGNTCT